MHDHDHDAADTLRPRGSRVEETGRPSVAAQAAAEGHWGAVGTDGMAQLQRSAGNAGVAAALQRHASHEGHEIGDGDEHVQRSPVHDVISSGGGRPLAPDVRTDMEARMGHDFGDVRVHDDSRAHDSAVAVNAHAYTVGSNIVFQRDRYDPASDAGKVTLAHELTHVVQQRNGPVDGTPAAGGISVSDPSDRFEREATANAERVMSAPAQAGPVSAAAVQREAEPGAAPGVEEQEEVQGSFAGAPLQREQAEEAEETPPE